METVAYFMRLFFGCKQAEKRKIRQRQRNGLYGLLAKSLKRGLHNLGGGFGKVGKKIGNAFGEENGDSEGVPRSVRNG